MTDGDKRVLIKNRLAPLIIRESEHGGKTPLLIPLSPCSLNSGENGNTGNGFYKPLTTAAPMSPSSCSR